MIFVAKDGTGDFTTIQEAIDSISDHQTEMIYIKKGIYHEKLVIEKSDLKFIGENADETIITFNDFARKQWNKSECYQTFRSYTLFIGGDYLTFENLTFKNEAGKGSEVGQALAAYVDGNYLYFKNCRFLAH